LLIMNVGRFAEPFYVLDTYKFNHLQALSHGYPIIEDQPIGRPVSHKPFHETRPWTAQRCLQEGPQTNESRPMQQAAEGVLTNLQHHA
jgi:hypothetical protein